jgi:predicted phosphodiesterase
MKLLFVTDLHGSKWKYDRLFEAAKEFQANVVINGGDMLPKNGEPFRQDICIQPGQLDEFTYVTIDLSTMKFDRVREHHNKEQRS